MARSRMTDSIYAWSKIGDDNATSDATVNWQENQDPQTVNNSARAMMARVAAHIEDRSPRRTSTGTANAYVVTAQGMGTTIRDGMVIVFFVHAENTSACTLNVNAFGSRPFRPRIGTEFRAGDLLTSQPVIAYYTSATNEWIGVNTGHHVSTSANGLALQSIVGLLPKLGDIVISASPTPAAGRIRLTEVAQPVLKTSYPELNSKFAAEGYPFGSTATHFNVPPAAGYFLRFAATNASVDTSGARSTGSTQADQNKTAAIPVTGVTATTEISPNPHSHGYNNSDTSLGSAADGPNDIGFVAGNVNPTSLTAITTLSGSATLAGGDEVRVKNVAFHADLIASTAESAAQIAVFGFPYQWDTGTTAADPGPGRVRGNNGALASITQLYVSNTDRWGQSLAPLWTAMATGNAFHLSRVGAQGNRVIAVVNGVPTAGAGFVTVPVSATVATGAFAINDGLAIEYGVGAVGAPGMTWRGQWTTATAYALRDGVYNAGSSYISKSVHTSGPTTEPGVGASWATVWDLIALGGGGGSGDVTAAAAFGTDTALIRANGTGKGVKASGITLDDNDNFVFPQTTFANPKGVIYQRISTTNFPFIHGFNYGPNGTLTTTGYNTFIGLNAGNFTMGATSVTPGADEASINTGIGYAALNANVLGHHNTAIGAYSMITNTNGYGNTAIGTSSLYFNTTGHSNAAIGFKALLKNTTGYNNSAVGISAMQECLGGYANAAFGQAALYGLTSGYANTAMGATALQSLTTANGCVGIGYLAGFGITTGVDNLAIGTASLYRCATGTNNIGIGSNALGFVDSGVANVGIATYAGYDITTGSSNVFIGYNTGRGITTGAGNTIIGAGIGSLAAGLTDTVIIAAGATKRLEIDQTGVVQLHQTAAFAANGTVATTLTAVGPTGANTTVQEWLKIKNSAGVTRYIPCY